MQVWIANVGLRRILMHMTIQPVITPAGRLRIESTSDSSAELAVQDVVADELRAAFGESSAAGLSYLASKTLRIDLPAGLVFWREFAQQLFHHLCGLGEEGLAQAAASQSDALPVGLAPPNELALVGLIELAPPMHGLEYVTPDVLRELWTELRRHVLRQAAEYPDGPAAFLRDAIPLWDLLGRVTLHLVENKRDVQSSVRIFGHLYVSRFGAGQAATSTVGRSFEAIHWRKESGEIADAVGADSTRGGRQRADSRAAGFAPAVPTAGDVHSTSVSFSQGRSGNGGGRFSRARARLVEGASARSA